MLNREQVTAALIDRDHGVAEVAVPPRSRMIGEEVRPGHVTAAGWVVLAVQRQGLDRGSATTMLQVGDTLLVEGRWEVLDASADDADVLVVDAPDLVRRQSAPLGGRSVRAIVVLLVMFLQLATGLVPPAAAALLAAGAMVILRVVAIQQAYRRIPWSTVLLVAGMLPMSPAIAGSGAGELVASLIVGSVAGLGAYALLAALFVVTLVFGQLISNTATALVMIPIAVSAAPQLDLSPEQPQPAPRAALATRGRFCPTPASPMLSIGHDARRSEGPVAREQEVRHPIRPETGAEPPARCSADSGMLSATTTTQPGAAQ